MATLKEKIRVHAEALVNAWREMSEDEQKQHGEEFYQKMDQAVSKLEEKLGDEE